MATQSWSTRFRHDSDAMFREWGSELAAKMGAAGLVRTADTGQINWTTVVRAGINSDAGYEIWRFNDTQQATAPIYFRINYGTGTTVNAPRIQIIVGTGSNGAGTITGVASVAQSLSNYATAQTVDTARQSYLCVVAGFFGLYHKSGSSADGLFAICRTVDSLGVATATGALVLWGGTATAARITQAFRFAATAVAYTVQTGVSATQLVLNPQSPISSAVGADNQAFLCWTITPQVAPLVGICGVIPAEVSEGSTFTTTLVGTTARLYIGLGTFRTLDSNQMLKPAMLWE